MITAPSAWVDTGTNTGTTLDAGHWTGSSAGTYSHTSSNGTIDENEDDHSDSTYHIDSNWSGGAWVNSGASTGHARLTGHWSIDSTGKYTHVGRSSTDGVTDYSSVTGSTGSNYSTDWNSGSTVTQTYVTFPATGTVQASEGWTESSGQQTAGGTVTSGWHYEGNGSNSNTSGSSGNLTGSLTGTYNNSSSITGTQGESERDSAGSTYSLTSNWVPATDDEAASWNTTGTNSGNATHTGHWSSSATGDYHHVTTGASGTGSSTVNGTRGTTHVTDWKTTSEVTQNWVNVPAAGTVSAHSEWQTATGTGLATTTTNDDWNYSGTGTYSDSAHTGSINEGGNNHAGDKSTVHSNWVPASGSATGYWADTGNATATSLDHGHWSSSGTGTYGRTTSVAASGTTAASASNVSGTTGVSHSTEWDTKGTITSNLTSHAARVTDDGTSLPASVTWDTGTGNITATGNTDDGWTYGGSGTYSDSTTPAGTITEDGNNNNHTDYTIHSDWTPSSAATSTAPAVEGHWVDTGTNTGTTLDAGHWTGSSTGTYSHAIGTTGGTVTGSTGVSHVVEWDTTGTVTLAMTTIAASGTVSAHTEWVMSDGVGDNHGSTTDGWGYNGSGTYTDENGTSQTINEDGYNSTVDAYSIHASWDTDAGAFGRYGDKTHTTTDGGHYTTSRHEPYQPVVGAYLFYYRWAGAQLHGDTTSATTIGWNHSTTATSRLNDEAGSWDALGTVRTDDVSTVTGVTSTASGEYTRSVAPAVPGLEINGSATQTVRSSDGRSFAWSTTLDAAGSLTASATTAHADHTELNSFSYEGSGSGSDSGSFGYFRESGYTESGDHSLSGKISSDWTLSGSGQWQRSGGHLEQAGHKNDSFDLSFSEGGNEFSHTLTHTQSYDQKFSRSADVDVDGSLQGSGSGTGTRSERVQYSYDSPYGSWVEWFTYPGNSYIYDTFSFAGQSDLTDHWEQTCDNGVWTGTNGQTYAEDDTIGDAEGDGPVHHYDNVGPNDINVFGPWNESWFDITPNGFEPLDYWVHENPFLVGQVAYFGQNQAVPALPEAPPTGGNPATGNAAAPAKPRVPLVPEDIGNSWFQAIKAVFGQADSRVQAAYDQSNWDRSHGTADAVVGQVGFSSGVGGHTFDAANRQGAAETATTIIHTTETAIAVVTTAQLATSIGRRLMTKGAAEVVEAGEGCLTKITCFVAGTQVLNGDGFSKTNIEDVYVGQRVATDGGLANSADGQTGADDPNETQVYPATWRLVTIKSEDGDWNVQTLVPLSWLQQHHAEQGGDIQLSEVVDLKEMGVPDGLSGHIVSIGDCPAIQSGPGRVVLTTVNHSNDFVYTLTLTDANGATDNLGITGYHKVYTEGRGWVQAYDLHEGETVRTADGHATVTGLVRNPGTFRVYNMTVESDHVYYVGDLTALVHNFCGPSQLHHIEPAYLNAGVRAGETVRLPTAIHRAVHDLIDERLADAFRGLGAPVNRYAGHVEWSAFFARKAGTQTQALQIARDVLRDVLSVY